jgi:PAS domain S-box-containing protein
MEGRRKPSMDPEEARYRELFEASPLPTWLTDEATGRFLLVNAAAVDQFGYARPEFSAMTLHSLRLPTEGGRDHPEFRVRPRAPRVLTVTWRLRQKDGRVVDVELRATRVTVDGRSALLTVVLDAVRERVVEALQWGEHHFDQALADVRVGSWTWSPLTHGAIWSQELRRMYGVPADAPASLHSFLAIVHVEDRPRVTQRLSDATDKRERRYDLEYRIVRPNGETRVMHARHTADYDLLGAPIHRAGSVQDVTERRRTDGVA